MRQIELLVCGLAISFVLWPCVASGQSDIFVDQHGEDAKAISHNLEQIKMPPGFEITLYAVVPGARHMAVGPKGVVTFVGTRGTDVWAVTDHDKDWVAEKVKSFAPSIEFDIPNGPCFAPDGVLYIAERNRILAFPEVETSYENPEIESVIVVAKGHLIPPDEESGNHSARVCRIGPDDRLYVALGQPFNVAPADKLDLYDEHGIGGIIAMKRDGSDRQVFSYGIRNSVGLDFNPASGKLWFTDNQVDGMGDLIPPGELNRQTEAGQHFGFPWFGGGTVRTNEYIADTPPDSIVHPVVETDAHAADLGMTFYTATQFPARYRGGIFYAQHGSWDRSEPIGARVMFTAVKADGSVGTSEIFAEGWLDENGEYLGRPVDVAVLPDGSVVVSDDRAGAIYRISYKGQ